MNKIIKEPLLHFLLLGGLLYIASMLWGSNNQAQEIIVSEGKIKHLSTLYEKTWQRKPSQQELEAVVQAYVLEQAAYYEGVSLGLDKNDIVITRRIRQKIDFIAEESISSPQVTDEILANYLKNYADKFRIEPKLTLRQIYLDPKKYGNKLEQKVATLLSQLQNNPEQDITAIGERYLFSPLYQQQTISQLNREFGQGFVQKTSQLSTGKWHAPVYSSYGTHLIYIEENASGELPELAQIRSSVLREWENSLRQQAIKQYYDELLTRYPVSIQWPTE